MASKWREADFTTIHGMFWGTLMCSIFLVRKRIKTSLERGFLWLGPERSTHKSAGPVRREERDDILLLPELAWTCTPFRVGFFEKPDPNFDFLARDQLRAFLNFSSSWGLDPWNLTGGFGG